MVTAISIGEDRKNDIITYSNAHTFMCDHYGLIVFIPEFQQINASCTDSWLYMQFSHITASSILN